jgi:hypothetical protein
LNKLQEGVSNLHRQQRRFILAGVEFCAGEAKRQKTKTYKHMSRTQRTLLVAAAITGLMTGVTAKIYAQDSTNAPGTNAPSGDTTGKHDCAGKNSCKGQGGCGGSKGTNSCKGQGGCNTKGSCKPG